MNRTLILIGALITIIGVLWPWLSRLPFGKLPGDIAIQREGFSFYFPLATSLLISAALSIVFWLFRK